MLPYSSNLRGGVGGVVIGNVHEAVWLQVGSTPPISTVAVTDWPPRPFVSTVIELVPWPLVIVPAETVQLYVSETVGVPCVNRAVTVAVESGAAWLGQSTLTVGQTRIGLQSVQVAIVTVVDEEV